MYDSRSLSPGIFLLTHEACECIWINSGGSALYGYCAWKWMDAMFTGWQRGAPGCSLPIRPEVDGWKAGPAYRVLAGHSTPLYRDPGGFLQVPLLRFPKILPWRNLNLTSNMVWNILNPFELMKELQGGCILRVKVCHLAFVSWSFPKICRCHCLWTQYNSVFSAQQRFMSRKLQNCEVQYVIVLACV